MRDSPISSWISGVRPALMASYWLNYHLWGLAPFSYHLLNVVVHFFNTGLVFLVLFRLLGLAGWARSRAGMAAVIGAVIFAIHPLQTESVSYVAGRSESLASFFMLLSYAIFLYRREPSISWAEAVLVLLVFGAAVTTKENAVSLAGVLVLTDVFWPVPFSWRGMRQNWRLYALMLPGVIAAGVAVARVLATSETAGFSVVTFKWYQYGFTEARVLFSYIGMALFPVGQSIDHDYPPSHTLLEHGAIFYVLLLGALVAISVRYRRRFPLSCFGLLMFLIFLAPTSSIIPLDDAFVERRMYLALLGLLLVACDWASRLRVRRAVAGGLLVFVGLAYCKLCRDRNQLWGQPDRLVEMAAAGAFYNPRPLLNFTEILIAEGRCDLAPGYLQRAEQRLPNNYYVNAAWGRTLACLGRLDLGMQRLQVAARIHPCSEIYEWMGLLYGQMGLLEQAGEVLRKAVELDPDSETAHGSLALWFENMRNLAAAEREYRTAMSLDRTDYWAKAGFNRVRAMEAGGVSRP